MWRRSEDLPLPATLPVYQAFASMRQSPVRITHQSQRYTAEGEHLVEAPALSALLP